MIERRGGGERGKERGKTREAEGGLAVGDVQDGLSPEQREEDPIDEDVQGAPPAVDAGDRL